MWFFGGPYIVLSALPSISLLSLAALVPYTPIRPRPPAGLSRRTRHRLEPGYQLSMT